MALKCIARRMEIGQGHEHIAYLWFVNPTGQVGYFSRDQMVNYIEMFGNASVWCPDANPDREGAWVHVHRNGWTKYVQTVADGRKTNNLLSLPIR